MKIHISENLDKAIDGFNLIPIVYGSVDLGSIPMNGATTIVAIDAVDSIKSDNIQDFINNVVSKMRLNSTLHIGGIDAYSLSKSLLSGTLDINDYNNQIHGKQGLYSCKYISDLLLQNSSVQILSTIFKGDKYEITATRNIN